ncbi:MAG: hypothetical protein ACREJG_12965 [Candidatus Rokuibacteriota bacterium]
MSGIRGLAPRASNGEAVAPAPTAESPTGRRFGELLVAEKILTAAQLAAALQLQAVSPTYVPIGQVLLANKFVTRKQLHALLHRHKKRSRLGDILLKAGCITEAQLAEALAEQRKTRQPLGQTLIGLRHVNETTMRDALCTQLHINFFDLDPIAIDRGLARLIPERFATRHLLVPLFRVDRILIVAMDDPSRAAFIEELQITLGLQIEMVTTTTQKLKAALGRLYGPPAAPEVDVFSRRNILIGPIRDHVVADLAATELRGVSILPLGWQ